MPPIEKYTEMEKALNQPFSEMKIHEDTTSDTLFMEVIGEY